MRNVLLGLFLSVITATAFSETFTADHDFLISTLKAPIDPNVRLVSFSYQNIRPTHGMQVVTGSGTRYNYAYPWCWLMGTNNTSDISLLFNFNGEEAGKDWYMNIKQLSSIAGDNYSPIAIDLNGINIADHFEPFRDAWRIDHFKLPKELLTEGQNTITIRLQDAYTHYWIENITLSPESPTDIWLLDFMGEKSNKGA